MNEWNIGDKFTDEYRGADRRNMQFQIVRFLGQPTLTDADKKLIEDAPERKVGDIVYVQTNGNQRIENVATVEYANMNWRKARGGGFGIGGIR